MTEALDLTEIEQLLNSLIDNGHPQGDVCLYCDPEPAREALRRDLPPLIARIRALEEEVADLRERPCAHSWRGTEEGIVCTYCGEAE